MLDGRCGGTDLHIERRGDGPGVVGGPGGEGVEEGGEGGEGHQPGGAPQLPGGGEVQGVVGVVRPVPSRSPQGNDLIYITNLFNLTQL